MHFILNHPQFNYILNYVNNEYGQSKFIVSKAAVLLINLIKKHPFHNANKRTAFLAAYVFFKLNGYSLKMENQEVVELVVRIATYQGEFDALKEATTDILKNNSTNIDTKKQKQTSDSVKSGELVCFYFSLHKIHYAKIQMLGEC